MVVASNVVVCWVDDEGTPSDVEMICPHVH